jgi:hypothetical protein
VGKAEGDGSHVLKKVVMKGDSHVLKKVLMKGDMESRVEEGADVGDDKVVQKLMIIGRQGCRYLDPVYTLCLVRINLAFHHAWHSTRDKHESEKYFVMFCLLCLICVTPFCAMSHRGSSIYPPRKTSQ